MGDFENFVRESLGITSYNQIKKENDFWIFMSSKEINIIYRKPFPVNSFVIEQISKSVQNESINTIKVILYSVFGTDSSGKNHIFYKRIDEISGNSLINKIKGS